MDGRPPGNTGCCRLFFFFSPNSLLRPSSFLSRSGLPPSLPPSIPPSPVAATTARRPGHRGCLPTVPERLSPGPRSPHAPDPLTPGHPSPSIAGPWPQEGGPLHGRAATTQPFHLHARRPTRASAGLGGLLAGRGSVGGGSGARGRTSGEGDRGEDHGHGRGEGRGGRRAVGWGAVGRSGPRPRARAPLRGPVLPRPWAPAPALSPGPWIP